MAAPVPLRPDFDAAALRTLAKQSCDPNQTRRLLALATIYDGQPRSEAARIGCVTLQSVRDWVVRFNAQGPAGLINGKAPGQPSKLNEDQRRALARMVEDGPIPAIHGVVRWRLRDLAWWVHEEFRISLDETTVGRELRKLGFRKLSARPQHYGQNEAALEEFKKRFQHDWTRSRRSSRPAPP
jgi:transposase